jgi:hypothetical protein
MLAAMGAPAATFGAVGFLVVRGMLLWLVVPAGACVWLVLAVPLRRRSVGMGAFVGWCDLNLIALLHRVGLRPHTAERRPWVHPRELPEIDHRVRFLDPA